MNKEFNNIFKLKNSYKRKIEHITDVLEKFGDIILSIADIIDIKISNIEQKVTQIEKKVSKIEIKVGLMNLSLPKPLLLPKPPKLPKNFMKRQISGDHLRTTVLSELEELFKRRG